LGETAGDLLSQTLQVGYAVSSLLLVSLFAVTLFLQLKAKKFHPWLYWIVILATSMAGTTLSDFMDRSLGLGYAKGSFILVGCLVGIFVIWRRTGLPLSMNKIRGGRAEALYWIAILVSNTLGTALGDFLADSSGLGFMGGAALIGGLIATVTVLRFVTSVSRTLLFWLAFVLTRPLGATLGDLLTKPHDKGGFNLGTLGSSFFLLGALGILIFYSGSKKLDKNISASSFS
jgi:uncharacterized membrane-anchored protein